MTFGSSQPFPHTFYSNFHHLLFLVNLGHSNILWLKNLFNDTNVGVAIYLDKAMFVDGAHNSTTASYADLGDSDDFYPEDSQTSLTDSIGRSVLSDTMYDHYSLCIEAAKAYASGSYDRLDQIVSDIFEYYGVSMEPYMNSSWDYSRCPFLNSYASKVTTIAPKVKETCQVAWEYSRGFSVGVFEGVGESGIGLGVFLKDLVSSPIETCKQISQSIEVLTNLVKENEWKELAEILVPEVCELVEKWDQLTPEERGRLSGYALGKNGGDILIPGACVKATSKGLKALKALNLSKKIASTGEILAAERALAIGETSKAAALLENGTKVSILVEEQGLLPKPKGRVKKSPKPETQSTKAGALSPSEKKSLLLHNKARAFLKPYRKKPLPEEKVRSLINQAGFPTYPRPAGIPEDYLVMLSNRGVGMKYVHPSDPHTYIRVMSPTKHSPNPSQKTPYVVQLKNGKSLDIAGKPIDGKLPEAHIPIEKFKYRK